jgi:DNA-binding response OmpR family regulator
VKTRLFLIDSEALNGARLCRKLEKQGYDVHWAKNGDDAVHNADFGQTDLLLIDLDIPPMESLGILSRLAETNPFLQVVGLTERTDLTTAVCGTGLSAVVEKPIDVGVLFHVMEKLLRRAPGESVGFKPMPRSAIDREHDPRHPPAELNVVSPATYSGWGINE